MVGLPEFSISDIRNCIKQVEEGKHPLIFDCPRGRTRCRSVIVYSEGRTDAEALRNLGSLPTCLHGQMIPPRGAIPS